MKHRAISTTHTAVLLAGLAACSTCAAPALAQDTWPKWPGSAYASNNDFTDRAFVKEWEAAPPKGFATLSSANIAATKAAIARYTAIVARGGWQPIPEVKLQQGSSDPAVLLLRARLQASGDLQEQGMSQSFDFYVDKAVKRYQASNGLAPTGVVDKSTVAALNVPAASRLKQLQLNLTRLAEHSKAAAKKYVVVNIPAAQIEAVENGQVVSRHSGVVGKIDRPTPLLKSAIHELNFNAVWHLPPTVIEQDLIPKGQDMARRGQSVLVKFQHRCLRRRRQEARPHQGQLDLADRQGPDLQAAARARNPLGFVKINFNNAHSVYMHDTPSQSLFGRNFRAASSGCVRVSGIEQLAAWLTAEQGWKPEHIKQMKETGERLDLKLKKPVPLYFVYVTAWATEDGVVQFRRDLYAKDGIGQAAAAY